MVGQGIAEMDLRIAEFILPKNPGLHLHNEQSLAKSTLSERKFENILFPHGNAIKDTKK
jgi:hypothetical protein